jgi:hypothetical protein
MAYLGDRSLLALAIHYIGAYGNMEVNKRGAHQLKGSYLSISHLAEMKTY